MNQVLVFLCVLVAVLSEASSKHSSKGHHGKDHGNHHGKDHGNHHGKDHGYHHGKDHGNHHGYHHDKGHDNHHHKKHSNEYINSLVQDEEAVFNQLKTQIKAAAATTEAAEVETETEAETAAPKVVVLQLPVEDNVASTLIAEDPFPRKAADALPGNVLVLQIPANSQPEPAPEPAPAPDALNQVLVLQVVPEPEPAPAPDALNQVLLLQVVPEDNVPAGILPEDNAAAQAVPFTNAAGENFVVLLQVVPNAATTVPDVPEDNVASFIPEDLHLPGVEDNAARTVSALGVDDQVLMVVNADDAASAADQLAAALNQNLLHTAVAKRKAPTKKHHPHKKQPKKSAKKHQPHYRIYYF